MIYQARYALRSARELQPNRFDLVAFPLVIGLIALFAWTASRMGAPLTIQGAEEISLDPAMLPDYALRTTVRMAIAITASFLFTLAYATLAAKSRRAATILIPMLDILQSVPVLGYISFTVTVFLALFPGSLLGVEMAAIFAIFSSQAWNMTFSLYQSLRTVPRDLDEAAAVFQFTAWQKFWRLELPHALPGLVWNAMMSMSAGWFFVVASEAISVGGHQVALPGIGSYIALAIEQRDLNAIFYAVGTMAVVILLYDQILFRPLVVWSDKFKLEDTPGQLAPRSWIYDLFRRTRLIRLLGGPVYEGLRRLRNLWRGRLVSRRHSVTFESRWVDRAWYALLVAVAGYAAWRIALYIGATVPLSEVGRVFVLGFYTALRVIVLITLAAFVWVPIGVMVGLRPKLAEIVQPVAQIMAAFPANLLFPLVAIVIVRYDLNPNIWLSPLMVLGTQWYILFNVVAGAAAFPTDLRDAAAGFRVTGWLWWQRVMLPGVFPYLLTGIITAAGGAWNAAIVAEAVSWGDLSITAQGLGSYIAGATTAGDFPRIVLGIAVMAFYVTLFNRVVFQPLYDLAGRKLRLT